MRRKKQENVDEGAPMWVVTYGDMMSLLLTFFIFLFAFSTINAQEFQAVMDALRVQLGILEGGQTLEVGAVANRGLDGMNISSKIAEELEFHELREQMENYVNQANLQSDVQLEMNERGLIIRMTGQVLFDLAKADLKPEGVQVLKKVGSFLDDIPNNIAVEGHTDDWPINTIQFPNNWMLSAARATTVILFFTDTCNISPKRLAASGYGEYRPLVQNTTEENRAKNRRVDIVILRTQNAQEEHK